MALYRFEGRKPQVGEGSFVAESALVIGNVQIGRDAYIGHGVILRGDYGTIVIGEGTAIEEGAIVHARPDDRTVFGRFVTLGHGAMVHNAQIKDYAVIGMRATISDYSIVGEWTIIGEETKRVLELRKKTIRRNGSPIQCSRSLRADRLSPGFFFLKEKPLYFSFFFVYNGLILCIMSLFPIIII
jgi:carbonic anhydrase/acetyltransferase-like protein (isoleucine patch superfamily)